jgi:2'-5' RNA ligase
VLVSLPEAEDVVGRFRADLDTSAGQGVPAHVTVLYPFVAPDRIDHQVLGALAEAVASVTEFHVTLARISWFGEKVVWLAPEPAAPFRALTSAVGRRFPDHPPYGGTHADPVPHLTVGHDAPIEVLRAAAAAIRPLLPVRAHVTAVRLMQGSAEAASWRTVAELPLRPA